MFTSLRLRLLLSYLVVLAITLGATSGALLLILNTQDAPPSETYQQLASIAISVNLRQLLQNSGGIFQPTEQRLVRLTMQLRDIAAERQVRLLIVSVPDRVIYWDSDGVYAQGEVLNGEINAYSFPTEVLRGTVARVDGVGGRFIAPDGQEWLFVGLEALQFGGRANALIFADPRPRRTLQQALNDFGTSLAPVVVQAGIVGVLTALGLSWVISRSIARPLQTVAEAAAAVAEGHYDQRVPISGPLEVRAVGESFNQMSQRVKTMQQAQQDLLANVSHDLKTPLTSIQGFSQAIIDGAAPDPVGAARIIYDEAARLNRMVVELTDLARLQAGRLSMQVTALDMGMLTRAAAQRLEMVARDKGVTLHVDAETMPVIAGDGDRLSQVLTNLIGNAIKYTPPGGEVIVTTHARDNGVEISVRDTGVGIQPSELPRIFERFYQVDKARGPQRGTGLGLAIVREIVQAHGGVISASSAGAGKGATFTVWLPLPNNQTVLRRREK